MEVLKITVDFIKNYPELQIYGLYLLLFLLLFFYCKNAKKRWRKILKKSIDYHIFHLSSIHKDFSINNTSRSIAQALLWGLTKQLKQDLAEGGGGRALLRSFSGDKTALNICGTVYYQCAMNSGSIDKNIIRLNDTLLSTFYRIFLLESFFSPLAVLYMDLTLLFCLFRKPLTGTGRLYVEMRLE